MSETSMGMPVQSGNGRGRDEAASIAERLAEAGRYREAIEAATEQVRAEPNAALEYALVRWRHLAYGRRGAARADWPVQAPDLFPGVDGPPEVQAADLTSTVLASAIGHHGCLIVRGLLSHPEAERLVDGINRAFDGLDAARAGQPLEQTLPWYGRFLKEDPTLRRHRMAVEQWGASLWTCDSPRMLFELLEVLERHGVLKVLEEHLGERPALSVEKGTLRRVPSTTGGEWHQDGRFLGAQVRAVNVWISLTECGIEAPGMDVLPRRVPYIVPTGVNGAKLDWTIGRDQVLMEAKGTPIVTPVFHPGDAMLFDQFFLHTTSSREGLTKSRWAIESWFFAPSATPQHHLLAV